jgi:pimeloyl-ACP methyl ester carboxylesterase
MTFLTVLGWLAAALFLLAAFFVGYFVLVTRRIAADAERRVPASGKFIDVAGNRVHYVETGEGRPILFVHGLGGQLHHFRHPLFPAIGPGYRLIALDRPGSGYSARARGATARLTEQADVIAGFIAALGLEKPLLVGHSLGGAVTLGVALNHPDAISGIVLLAPLTHMEESVRAEFKGLYIKSPLKRWLLANTVAVPTSLKYAPQTLDFVFGPQKWPEDYIIKGGGMVGLRPSHFYGTASDTVAIELDLGQLQARYGEIKMPAGMMFGTADRVLDHKLHGLSMQGRIEGLELEMVEGLGHMVPFMATERAAALIRRIADRAFAA